MRQITFVVGGCRSGKSRFALEYADRAASANRIFIATSIPKDDEMKARVLQHQQDRGDHWKTVEAPIRLPEVIIENNQKDNLILIDCITLWLNNLLFENDGSHSIDAAIKKLRHTLGLLHCTLVMVSNEVGMGIVPENKLARQFRDLAGSVNQALAACSDQVVWVVAGIPVFVKGTESTLLP